MVFQDPAESLNARHTVGYILEEPFVIHGLGNAAERRRAVDELLGQGRPAAGGRASVSRSSFQAASGSG